MGRRWRTLCLACWQVAPSAGHWSSQSSLVQGWDTVLVVVYPWSQHTSWPQYRLVLSKLKMAASGSLYNISSLCNIMPHRLHTVCKMWPIATDVARSMVCVSVCGAHGWAVQKRLNRSRCHLGSWLMRVQGTKAFKEPCIWWSQDRMNPFAVTWGNKSAMWTCAKLL